MAIEFLGHKSSVIPFIFDVFEKLIPRSSEIVDLFSGTGAVSAELKRRGWQVIANDNLAWCSVFAESILLNNNEPEFLGLTDEINIGRQMTMFGTPYESILAYLNTLKPIQGFIFKNYSPASIQYSKYKRMYFTEENAGLIDAIRLKISEWETVLSRGERALILSDLIKAANSVSNIAGTYGCYLKQWKVRSRQRLKLRRSEIIHGPDVQHSVLCADANQVISSLESPVCYADPPYTKRQYAAYYHILETIALGDEPKITGSTGLRPWKGKSSDYCYKDKAPKALEDLLSKLHCKHFFLSYNEDGQIPHETLMSILTKHSSVSVWETMNRRYKSSLLPHKGPTVLERLYYCNMKGISA